MAIIDVVKWNAPPEIYAWKFPSEELATWTQLIVAESQEAMMVKEGRFGGPFKAGRYTLDTKNIPFLTRLVEIPFGGKTPFTAEIWFVNKVMTLDVKWGTADPIQLQDPKYNVMLPVRAFGQYGVKIEDTKKFLLKLVGTIPAFDRKQLSTYFRGLILTMAKDAIATEIIKQKISILEISANLTEISAALEETMRPKLAEFGLGLVNFFVNSINTPEDDPAVMRLKEALAKRAEMDIIGFTYQQERSFDTMETAAGNEGGGAGQMMGAGMGLGMGVGIGGAFGGAMGGMADQINTAPQSPAICPKCKTANQTGAKFCSGCGGPLGGAAAAEPAQADVVICDKCGTEAPVGSKFCPSCGDPFICCPSCGTDNPEGNAVCLKCGSPMPVKCADCGADVPGNSKFCPGCGKSMVTKCTKCDTALQPGARFCPECGTPTEGEG